MEVIAPATAVFISTNGRLRRLDDLAQDLRVHCSAEAKVRLTGREDSVVVSSSGPAWRTMQNRALLVLGEAQAVMIGRDVANTMQVSRSAASRALGKLVKAGLATAEAEGRTKRYRLTVAGRSEYESRKLQQQGDC